MSAMRRLLYAIVVVLALLVLAALAIVALNLRGEDKLPDAPAAFNATPAQVERGRYLALAGNCAGCHTTRGGAPYAGGLGIDTPFGTVYASNLTPDEGAGIGSWSAAHFWRAMHNGRSKDGRLLYPAFPYPSFTRVTREDSDAIYAYLRTVPPAPAPNAPHKLRFPYDTQAALAAWRALFFTPGTFVADPARPAEWNRGAYLVDGLGHCIACHGTRNVLGATEEKLGLAGGPVENWYAPSLNSKREAGVADWDAQHVVALLKNGTSPRGSVMGPMADVVYRSTQYLSDADLQAMAVFLKQLPEGAPAAACRDSTRAPRCRPDGARREDLRPAMRLLPRRRGPGRRRRLPGAGRQPRGQHGIDRQPGADAAPRRLPARHRRQSAPLRHAALRPRARRRRHRRRADLHPRLVGQRRAAGHAAGDAAPMRAC